jgi:o-succinylbenzoate synthase
MKIIKIKNINVFTFDLPLKKGFALKSTFIDSRKGALVEFETEQRAKYYGESSPLVHFHRENCSECIKQISEIKEMLLGNPHGFYIEVPEEKEYDMEDFRTFFTRNFLERIKLHESMKNPEDILPSVRYCFEMIYLCIFIKNFDFIRHYNVSAESFIPLYRLISDIRQIDYGVLEEEIRSGIYDAVKIKIGRQAPECEISAIKKIINIIEKSNRKNMAIRLDSNMSLSANRLTEFFKKIDKEHIDFIEDPFDDTSFYREFYEKTGVGIAADETIKEFIDLKKMSFKKNSGEFIKALIIKPQVIGGFIDSFRLLKMAESLKIRTVISNIFETSISVSALCIFIYLTGSRETSAGLDTLDSFLKDPGTVIIKTNNARISVCRAFENLFKADYSVLKKCSG